jgi:hypothetical protein
MKKYQYIVCSLLLAVQSVQSQDLGFDEDVQDVQEASVDAWVLPVIILAIAVVFFAYRKNFKKV